MWRVMLNFSHLWLPQIIFPQIFSIIQRDALQIMKDRICTAVAKSLPYTLFRRRFEKPKHYRRHVGLPVRVITIIDWSQHPFNRLFDSWESNVYVFTSGRSPRRVSV